MTNLINIKTENTTAFKVADDSGNYNSVYDASKRVFL